MDRRRFLKVTAVTGVSAALASCGHPENQIIRFIPEDDFVAGVATYKPSICPLCTAGCGLNVRIMDADVDVVRDGQKGVVRRPVAKKLEGLPAHPVNRGALCARGQAAIQVTYHPDRLRQPMKRRGTRGSGDFQPVTWDEAIAELTARLDAAADAGRTQAIAYLSRPRRSVRDDLVSTFLERLGAPPQIRVALLEEDVLRRANAISFGRHQLPTIDLSQSRFVIAFGADFLGTWNSPVAQAAGYGAMRQGTRGVRGTFVQVESRMSQSGANADMWIPVRPGTEGALAMGLAQVINGAHPEYTPDKVESITGVPAARIQELARAFAESPRAVAIIGGPALAHTNALSQALAVNALNAMVGSVNVPGGIQFTADVPGATPPQPAAAAVAANAMPAVASFASRILSAPATPVDVLLLDDANPVFLSPNAWRVKEAIERVPFIASFGSFVDETSMFADLILPDHSFLESWTDAIPESGSTIAAAAVAGPVMRPLHATRATPDVLIDVAKRLKKPLAPAFTWATFDEMLKERFAAFPAAADTDAWAVAQERGGWWAEAGSRFEGSKFESSRFEGSSTGSSSAERLQNPRTQNPRTLEPSNLEPWTEPQFAGAPGEFPFHLLPYASAAFYDGSTAHLPWLQEMPDPLTSAMWSNWIEINPRTAERLGLSSHDIVEIASPQGSVRAPVVISPGTAPDIVAMPLGQGHTSFTRYASGRGSNPIAILAPLTEPRTGALAWAATRVRLTRVAEGDGELILFAGGDVEHPHEHR